MSEGAVELKGHSDAISALCIWDDKLYSGGKDKTIREWSVKNLSALRTFNGHTRRIRTLVAGPYYLFSGGWDETIRIWSLETGECLHILTCAETNALYFEPATLRLFSGGGDGRGIYEWDVTTGALTSEMEPRDRQIGGTVVCMTGDGVRLFVGMSDGAIALYDLDTGSSMGFFDGHAAEVTDIALLDERCYSSGNDKRVLEWDIATGQLLRRFEGHGAYVSALAVVDGEVESSEQEGEGRVGQAGHAGAGKMISGAWDGTLRVWDLETGNAEGFLRAHRLSINAIAVFGKKLFTAGGEGVIKAWDIEKITPTPADMSSVAIPMTPSPPRHLFNPFVLPPPMPPYYAYPSPQMMYPPPYQPSPGEPQSHAPIRQPRPPPVGGQVCTFFLQGRCRFGDTCRNVHPGVNVGGPE